MRKFLAALALIPTVSYGANWKLIVDSTSGSRLLVDADSVRIEKYKKSDGPSTQIYATMDMMDQTGETVFVSVIDAKECLNQNGGVLVLFYNDKSTATYFWSGDGNKMYDAQGQWLCGYLKGYLESNAKNKKQRL